MAEYRRTDRIAYGLLTAWCLLPIIMLFYCILVAVTEIPFVELGWTEYDFIVPSYSPQINAYLLVFCVLGCITLLFSGLSLISRRKYIFTFDQIKSHPWMIFLFLLFIWMILSTILADDPVRAFTGSTYLYNGMGAYIVFAGVFICAAFICEEYSRRNLLRLFCGVITFLSTLIIIQVFFETIIDDVLMSDLSAVFNQHNHFGYVLCMAIIGLVSLFLYDEKAKIATKTIYLCALGIDVLALLLNYTFGSYLAAFLALPFVYIFYIRSGREFKTTTLLPVLIFLAVSAVDCYGLLPTEATLIQKFRYFLGDVNAIATNSEYAIHAGTGRGILWKQTIERIKERPLFGFGPDGFYDENAIISHDGYTHDSPHNEFLQMAGFSGIPALLFYLGALVVLAVHHWKKIKELEPMVIAASGVTVTYLLSSFFGNPVFNTAPYFFMFLGLIAGTGKKEKEEVGYSRFSISMLMLCLIACMSVSGLLYAFTAIRNSEKLAEFADLQALNNAHLTVQARDKIGELIGNDFWYDATNFSLIPVSEAAPTAYGMGTKLDTNILKPFNWKYDTKLEYDGSLDYRDKIIKIHTEGSGDDLKIRTEWVPAQ